MRRKELWAAGVVEEWDSGGEQGGLLRCVAGGGVVGVGGFGGRQGTTPHAPLSHLPRPVGEKFNLRRIGVNPLSLSI